MWVKLMARGFEIRGADKLMRELKDNADVSDIKNVIKMNGSEMQRNAQRRSPVDTGNMKRSIFLRIEDGGMTAKVVSEANYSAYVNFGTRFMTARPFMTSSFNEQKIKFNKDMNRLLK